MKTLVCGRVYKKVRLGRLGGLKILIEMLAERYSRVTKDLGLT